MESKPDSVKNYFGYSDAKDYKFFDVNKTSTAIGITWAGAEMDPAANCLFYPVPGTGLSERQAIRVVITHIELRGCVDRAVQAAWTSNSINRVALVLDTQTNGVQLNAEDVFTGATDPVFGHREMKYNERFIVLWDETYEIHYECVDSFRVLGSRAVPFVVKLDVEIPVTFKAGAGSVADIVDNSLHVIAMGRDVGAGTTASTLTYRCRCLYKG